ncbi:nitroreductase/quinone reductase family protein [Streptomyces lasalocidi]
MAFRPVGRPSTRLALERSWLIPPVSTQAISRSSAPTTVSWAGVSPGPRVSAAHRRGALGLLAHPAVRIEVGDDVVAVRAVELRGAERDTAYAEQAGRYPGFAGYQRKTRRVIPVVALIPTGEGTVPADRTERTSS